MPSLSNFYVFLTWLPRDTLEGFGKTWTLEGAVWSAWVIDSLSPCISLQGSPGYHHRFSQPVQVFLRVSDVSQVHEANGSAWGGPPDSSIFEQPRSPSRCLASDGLYLAVRPWAMQLSAVETRFQKVMAFSWIVIRPRLQDPMCSLRSLKMAQSPCVVFRCRVEWQIWILGAAPCAHCPKLRSVAWILMSWSKSPRLVLTRFDTFAGWNRTAKVKDLGDFMSLKPPLRSAILAPLRCANWSES